MNASLGQTGKASGRQDGAALHFEDSIYTDSYKDEMARVDVVGS